MTSGLLGPLSFAISENIVGPSAAHDIRNTSSEFNKRERERERERERRERERERGERERETKCAGGFPQKTETMPCFLCVSLSYFELLFSTSFNNMSCNTHFCLCCISDSSLVQPNTFFARFEIPNSKFLNPGEIMKPQKPNPCTPHPIPERKKY